MLTGEGLDDEDEDEDDGEADDGDEMIGDLPCGLNSGDGIEVGVGVSTFVAAAGLLADNFGGGSSSFSGSCCLESLRLV